MKKLFFFVAALIFVATNINAEKLSGTLSSNMNAYSTWSESYPLTNANDGSYSTKFWSDAAQETGEYVTMSLAEQTSIGEIVFYFADGDRPGGAKVEVSANNSEWETVATFSSTDISTEGTYTCDAEGLLAQYVRLIFTQSISNWFQLVEFEVYEAPVNITPRTISVSVADTSMGTAYIGEEGVTEVTDQTGVVRLEAIPATGYKFVNWTLNGEEVATTASFVDKTEGDKAYVANFAALQLFNIEVSVNDAVMGSVSSTATGDVYEGTEITLTATPAAGYEFVNWTVGESVVSEENPYVTIVEASAEYKANFKVKPEKLKLVDADVSMSSYSSYVDANIIDGDMSSFYDSQNSQSVGATVTVTLAEESSVGRVKIYFSAGWSGVYAPQKAKIQVSTDNVEWTDVDGGEFTQEDLAEDNSITIDTDMLAKYVRMYIVERNTTYLTIYEFEVYESPVNVAPRTISVSVNDATMGTAYIGMEGITSVTEQTGAVRLFATPASNAYRFVNWTVEGEEVATSVNFTDRTEGDKAYVANFEAKPIYEVNVSSANSERGGVSSTAPEVVYEGDEVTFTATSVDGYKFSAWTIGTDTVSTANPYTVTIEESVAIVANFDIDPMLNRTNWTIKASSEESIGEGAGNGVASCIIDGSASTFWHTQYNGSEPGYPHWFMIDMQESKAFDTFEYVSRGTGTSDLGINNGNIVNYILYVSDTEIDPENLDAASKVTEGTFTYDGTTNIHKVTFTSVKARYVMLYATGQSSNGRQNASCVEFYLYSNAYAVSVSSSDIEKGKAYIGTDGVTTVGCSIEGTDVVTLTAEPAPRYQFKNWTLNGEIVSTDAVYTTTLITENRSYVANFEFIPIAPREVKVSSNDKTKGYAVFVSPMPEGTATNVITGDIVTVEAIAQSSDDFFVNWTINGVEVGTEPIFEYLGAEAATIQANFISKYVVTITPNEGGTISVKSGGAHIATGDRVLEGNYISLEVTEKPLNELKKLFINGEDVFIQYKYNPDYCVQVNGPITIEAEYGDPICYFTYECTGNGWIEAWETDTYDELAEEEGTLELPVLPAGEQYAYGDAVPFLGTAAIFAYPGEGAELISIKVNGEELDLSDDSDIIYYGDYFIDPVEGPIHIVAEFTGESTGVETAEISGSSVYAVAGGVQIEAAEATNVEVYSIAGTMVAEKVISGTTTIALEKGVYIVKAANEVVKVNVK